MASDGIVVDERSDCVSCANPAFGLTSDGRIVLVVDRASFCNLACASAARGKYGEHAPEPLNSVYYVSSDNGRRYERKGPVDPSDLGGMSTPPPTFFFEMESFTWPLTA